MCGQPIKIKQVRKRHNDLVYWRDKVLRTFKFINNIEKVVEGWFEGNGFLLNSTKTTAINSRMSSRTEKNNR